MPIITISREYGAGGHSIGRSVAAQLGIEFYDRDIIKQVAIESGIDPELIEQSGEEISKTEEFVRSIVPISYDQKDAIFNLQKEIILKIAAQGPCVILGRCADFVLKEAGIESMNVFLYAGEASRMNRVGELVGSDDPAVIRKAIKRTDHNRHSYYSYYTEQDWGDYRNYNMMLDTGSLGYEACVKLICEAYGVIK